MRPVDLRVYEVESTAQESSTAGTDLLYSAVKFVVPSSGIWSLDGFAGCTSIGNTDAKALWLAKNGVPLPSSRSGASDGAVGVYASMSTTWKGPLAKGDVIQLYGQRNGSSIIQMGATGAPNTVSQRIQAQRTA